jgi:CHAT domain-containing protein
MRTAVLLVLILVGLAFPASSQSFSTCRTGDDQELDRSIAAHEEHTFRLQQKFLDVFYYRGEMPHDCVRAARRRGIGAPSVGMPASTAAASAVLARASERLLPPPIGSALVRDSVTTLIIVPIAELGHIPFAALRFADSLLVDRMSVTIAPGFYAFKDPPRQTPRELSPSLIVGDPEGWRDPEWTFPQLPHAREEAQAVASLTGGRALVGQAATRERAELALGDSAVRLVYLATHGVSSSEDPRDASFLVMSDGRWPAAEIQKLRLTTSRPLVVLSACQTALGKDFEVGTIGMARAWYRAGASSVVMSLWNVDDESTARLMIDFVRLVRDHPVDEALRLAMRESRRTEAHPARWAGFSVFGLPGR